MTAPATVTIVLNAPAQTTVISVPGIQGAPGITSYGTATSPIFSPVAGSYSSAQTVSLSCVTTAAGIYFTLDGTTPTTASTRYAAPISVNANETIKAIANAPGYTQSAVSTAAYVISIATAAAPTFSPSGGTFTSTQSVALASTTTGSSIYYTVDGTTPVFPVAGSTSTYSSAISVAVSKTIKAIAVATSFVTSAVSNSAYVITTAAAAPTFSPVAGTYTPDQTVALSGPSGAVIYFTTDGTTPTYPPTGTTQTYSTAIPVPSPAVVAPTASPAAGTYTAAQTVTLATTTSGAVIYYTSDGSTPTTASAVYSSTIPVSASETLSAIAVKGGTVSSLLTAAYTINVTGVGYTQVFNYPNFSTSAGLSDNYGSALISGGVIALIPQGSGHVSGAVWYSTPVNVAGGFTADFTFQFTAMSTIPSICGGTFCIQNTTSVANPVNSGNRFTGDANACGYGAYNPADYSSQYPPVNSAAIKFDANADGIFGYKEGGAPSSTGYYENGGSYDGLMPFNDLQPDGINFYNGNIIRCHIVYDGVGTVVATFTDTSTGSQSRMEWPSNWQNAMSSNTGYVGWTGGSAGTTPEGLNVLSASFGTGFLTRLSQPTFSIAAGQYAGSQTVTLSAAAGSTIYYTTNGHLPTTAATQYTGPITVVANTIVKVIAVQSGCTDSITATAAYQIGTSNHINCSSGFSVNNGVVLSGSAVLSGSQVQLTNVALDAQNSGCSGSIWWATPVPITTFSTAFTLQYSNMPGGANNGYGGGFVLQNTPPAKSAASTARLWPAGLYAVGGIDNGFGQGGEVGGSGGGDVGFLYDVIVAFDLHNTPNSVGFYSGGANCTGSQIATGITFAAGNPINCTLAYDGSNLAITMVDTVIGGTPFSHTWTSVNIPTLVGGNTAYAGFVGSTFYNLYGTHCVNSWSM
jgi:hypothetical protein